MRHPASYRARSARRFCAARGAAAWCALLLALCTAASPIDAWPAQPYPARPVRIVVPFSAGGGTDIIARLLAQKLSEAWGQQVVVDNRAGGGAVIGTEIVAKSGPDGYTLLLTANPHTANPVLNARLPYDALRDFAAVTMVASAPLIVVVHPSLPVRSVRELIAFAAARPGELSYGSSGNGGPQHLAGELFKSMARIDMVHVPYKGSAPATTDLLAGQVQVGFSSMLTVLPHVKSSRLRALAVTGARRSNASRELPTVAESGVPGFEATTWYGVFAPAGAPRAIVAKLSADIARALNVPEIRDRLSRDGSEPAGTSPEAFSKFVQAEIEKLRTLVKTSGMRVD